MPARAHPVAILAAGAALALGGCGERRGDVARTTPTPIDDSAASPGAAVAALTVSLVDYRIDPGNPRVRRAGRIAFTATNDGQEIHALRIDGPTGEVGTQRLRPGERATIVVRLPPGTYKWYCPVGDHERRGMAGRVHVAE